MNRIGGEQNGLTCYVTENGMANPDQVIEGKVDDAARIAYFNSHLAQLTQLKAEGLPVKGYFAWSLLDNFEWAFGYDKRFGIVHVDFDNQQRTPKPVIMLGNRRWNKS